jgi:NitT/TauT family transport system substrate-binding protein
VRALGARRERAAGKSGGKERRERIDIAPIARMLMPPATIVETPMRRCRSIPGALVAGALALAGSAHAAEPLKIRQGWAVITTILAPIVFEKNDIMKHYGVSYVVEPIHFASSSAELTALATGDIDIMVGGPITLAHAVENAGMTDMRIIADGYQDGIDGYYSSRFEVLNDSGIKTIDDLKGKALVSNGLGGTLDVVIRAAMAEHHMVDKKDYTLLEAELSAQNAMLLGHKVDLIGSTPPFAYDPELLAKAHPLFTMKDIMGASQMTVLFARAGFLAKNRAAMVDYFADLQRGVAWFLDPANRDAMLAIVARVTKQPASRFANYLYTKADYYHDPQMRPNLKAIQHDIDALRSLGYVKAALDTKQFVDLSAIDAAEKRTRQQAGDAKP